MVEKVVFISKAVKGQEYLSKNVEGQWVHRVMVKEIGSAKSHFSVWVPGYGWSPNVIVGNHTLLKEMPKSIIKPSGAQANTPKEKVMKKPQAPKVAKPVAPKPQAKPQVKKPAAKLEKPKPRLVFMRGCKEKVERIALPKVPKGQMAPKIKVDGHIVRAHYRIHMSAERIRQCEQAEHTICHCRCGGVLHGKSHAKLVKLENDLFIKHKGTIPGAVYVKEVLYKIGGKPKAQAGKKK